MKLGVLDKEDRLLFLIHDELGRVIGHAGFANGLNEQGLLELDNILRGESFSRKGIMSEAITALQNWGKTVLFADGFYLRVLASNTRAVSFYDKLGYVEVERDPLKMIVEEGIEKNKY